MSRGLGIALLVFLLPAVARAQQAPEDLLPVGAQVYVRWDGIEAHRAAYDKTALGKMMQGDTGKFVANVFTTLQETLGGQLTVQQLLGGVPPEKLQKVQADAVQAPKLLGLLGQHGFVMAVEVRRLEPPDGQITLIVPEAGGKSAPLFASLRLAAALAGMEVKEAKAGGRTVSHLDLGMAQVAWWAEGKHAVVVAGTEAPEAMVKRVDARDARLSAAPLYKKVQGFKQFETAARAYVDVAALVKLARTRGKEVGELIDGLGLDGVSGLTFYSGFDGPAERSLVEIDTPGPRKGALKLLAGKPFGLADVPPLPPDVVSWSMTNFDPSAAYELGGQVAEGIFRVVSPEELPRVKEFFKQVDTALGIDLRKDLLANLGDRLVQYSSPAEGPLSLGQTFAFKVKDGKKALAALDQAVKGLANTTGSDISVKRRTYRGVEVHEVHFRQEGFFFVPTYALYKDWLVAAYFPQPVQGFILRASGELPAWKPEERLQASLGQMPKEFIAVSLSDPVPSVKQLLSLAPLVGGLIRSFAPDAKFEVGTLPNAHEATRHLFPNVTVVTDDGKALRMETRASLALPMDLTGLDTYALLIAFGFARIF